MALPGSFGVFPGLSCAAQEAVRTDVAIQFWPIDRRVANLVPGALLRSREQQSGIKSQRNAHRAAIFQIESQPVSAHMDRQHVRWGAVILSHSSRQLIWPRAVPRSELFVATQPHETLCSSSVERDLTRTWPRILISGHEHGPVPPVPNCKIQSGSLVPAGWSAQAKTYTAIVRGAILQAIESGGKPRPAKRSSRPWRRYSSPCSLRAVCARSTRTPTGNR